MRTAKSMNQFFQNIATTASVYTSAKAARSLGGEIQLFLAASPLVSTALLLCALALKKKELKKLLN